MAPMQCLLQAPISQWCSTSKMQDFRQTIAQTSISKRLHRGCSNKSPIVNGWDVSKRFASEQFRHFSSEPCRFANKHALEGRHALNQAKTDIAHKSERV